MELKEKGVDFLLHIAKNKFIAKESQKIIFGLDYNLLTWNLRDSGLIKNDGITKNNSKIWVLTEKGFKIIPYLQDLKKAYESERKIKEIVRQ